MFILKFVSVFQEAEAVITVITDALVLVGQEFTFLLRVTYNSVVQVCQSWDLLSLWAFYYEIYFVP